MLVADVMQAAVLTITPQDVAAGGDAAHAAPQHGQPSSRIDVRLPEDSATVADLVHAVEDASVAISSLMTLTDRSGHKDVVIRVRSIDPRAAVANLETRGYAVRDPRNG
jgi:hypothetical protein